MRHVDVQVARGFIKLQTATDPVNENRLQYACSRIIVMQRGHVNVRARITMSD